MSSTTQRRSRLQHRYCIGVSRRSAQATAGKGLAQGPYVVARAGVEPTTLRLKVIVSTKAPPRPVLVGILLVSFLRILVSFVHLYENFSCAFQCHFLPGRSFINSSFFSFRLCLIIW